MTGQDSRRFTLADVMISVAATAVGLTLWRLLITNRTWWGNASFSLSSWLLNTTPFLLAAALAFLGMRLLPPRPERRAALTQPGAVACLVVIAAFLVRAISINASMFVGGLLRSMNSVGYGVESYALAVLYAGQDVALVWVVLRLVGVWRPSPDWVDRAARSFGWFMIAIWVLSALGI